MAGDLLHPLSEATRLPLATGRQPLCLQSTGSFRVPMAAPEMPACETPHPKFGQALSTVEPSSAVLQANCGIMGYWDFIRHPRCLFFRFRRSHLIPRFPRPELGHAWTTGNASPKGREVEMATAETPRGA